MSTCFGCTTEDFDGWLGLSLRSPGMKRRIWRLNRGFDLYYDVFQGSSFLENDPGLVERKAEPSVDEALEWLRRSLLHYREVYAQTQAMGGQR